jgi:hypothetical protein
VRNALSIRSSSILGKRVELMMQVVIGSNNMSKSGGLSNATKWRPKGGLTSISIPFRFDENRALLHYLILFACSGVSIGLPDSFYVQWSLYNLNLFL